MEHRSLVLVLLCLVLSSCSTFALEAFQLNDDWSIRLCGRSILRWEIHDRNLSSPGEDKGGPRQQQFRTQNALSLGADYQDWLTFQFSLENRIYHTSTQRAANNNNGKTTWEEPDEVVIGEAFVELKKLLGGPLSIRLGRQKYRLGNGLIICDGTPYDTTRTSYFDGVTLKYHTDADTLHLFSFYDRWKDGTVFINDRNRRLRPGNVFTLGAYWTHSFQKELKLDTYYVFSDVDDTRPDELVSYHKGDSSASLHVTGLRLFGNLGEYVDYSLEGAWQFGYDAAHEHYRAELYDARMGFRLDDVSFCPTKLTLYATHLSGDDPETARNEGWNPLMSRTTLWSKELLPDLVKDIWSNLNQLRAILKLDFTKELQLQLGIAEYYAAEKDAVNYSAKHSGNGRHFGMQHDAALTYKPCKSLSFKVILAHFHPGNYFSGDQRCFFTRFQMIYEF